MILSIPAIRVQAANAAASSLLVNAAPVLPAVMFAHALGRQCGEQPTGVAVVHHDAQMLGESFPGRFAPQQRRGAVFIDQADYPQGSQSLSLQPTASVHLLLSLVLRFEQRPDFNEITSFLRHARIAGGSVLEHGPLTAHDTDAELLEQQTTGFWLVERTDLVDADDPLDSILAALQAPATKTTDDGVLGNTWLSGAVLGYAATTPFEKRRFVREGDSYLHAFCEPLVGLVQHLSVNDYRRLRPQPAHAPWWSGAWLQDDVFVVRQDAPLRHAPHPEASVSLT